MESDKPNFAKPCTVDRGINETTVVLERIDKKWPTVEAGNSQLDLSSSHSGMVAQVALFQIATFRTFSSSGTNIVPMFLNAQQLVA